VASNSLPLTDYQDHALAQIKLAEYLHSGSLALFLGAGVSRAIGLPDWVTLVRRCMSAVGEQANVSEDTSIDDLLSRIESIEKKANTVEKYHRIVHDCLYQGVTYKESIVRQPLLIALGALMMGSRRGSANEVLTLNFDDVLEWYLDIHGFSTTIVTSLPRLQQSVDVAVYHPHGFLPMNIEAREKSDFLIFSQYSYDERLGATQDPWKELIRDLLTRKVALFVGLSGKDPALRIILPGVKNNIGKLRPTGFWMRKELPPSGNKVGNADEMLARNTLLDRNVVPVTFAEYSEIPSFLLSICQTAMDATRM
jgi:hypothetical protein